MGYVVALDIGTTSTRAIAFDHGQRIAGVRQQEVSQYYPEPGWVEEDAMELWASSFGVLQELLALKGIHPDDVKVEAIDRAPKMDAGGSVQTPKTFDIHLSNKVGEIVGYHVLIFNVLSEKTA